MGRKKIRVLAAVVVKGADPRYDGYIVEVGDNRVIVRGEHSDEKAGRYADHRRERIREKARRRKGKHHA